MDILSNQFVDYRSLLEISCRREAAWSVSYPFADATSPTIGICAAASV